MRLVYAFLTLVSVGMVGLVILTLTDVGLHMLISWLQGRKGYDIE